MIGHPFQSSTTQCLAVGMQKDVNDLSTVTAPPERVLGFILWSPVIEAFERKCSDLWRLDIHVFTIFPTGRFPWWNNPLSWWRQVEQRLAAQISRGLTLHHLVLLADICSELVQGCQRLANSIDDTNAA